VRDLATADDFPGDLEGEVEVIQTHASVVFLVGGEVFKVKKSLDLGFLDYSDPGRRRHYCEREVEMNRPLAPGVYLGVLCLRRMNGHWRFVDGTPKPGELTQDHEWAVHMRRLDDGATMASRLAEGRLDFSQVRRVARRIAEFHARAEQRNAAVPHARFERVAENCRDNFAPLLDVVESPQDELVRRLQACTEAELERVAATIQSRVSRGMPRDGHGDLRLEHVYLLDERPKPHDLVIIDRIEFSDRFRLGDPAIDLAFLVMELRAFGHVDFADALVETYVETTGDRELYEVLPLFVAYRATVRAKVAALKSGEDEIDTDERARARSSALARIRLALATIEPPQRRPCMLLVCGLPGTGKSTVAGALAEFGALTWIRADVVRKELAGLEPLESGRDAVGEGIYTARMTERTYATCLARAREVLDRGGRVVVDATFKERDRRESFLDMSVQMGVPLHIVGCELEPEEVQRRIAARKDDPSDADWNIYQATRDAWEPFEPNEPVTGFDTAGSLDNTRARVHALLAELGLGSPR